MTKIMKREDFSIGDHVCFGSKSTNAKVIKLNRVWAVVELLVPRGDYPAGTHWRAKYAFLKKLVIPVPRSEQEILDEIQSIECALSPENLSRDGLLSQREIRSAHTKLTTKKIQLIKELGRTPSFEEIWGITLD
jgi:hypothetical protein